jgi:hypothetical protein
MKIILSRKGFDSSCGGAASPICPDGRLLSLPIPSEDSPVTYGELQFRNRSLGRIVEELTNGRVQGQDGAHIDPDLRESAYPRLPGWRPLFGQDGSAQGHLANAGVGLGDLFLFFGWFRRTARIGQRHRFVQGGADLHVLFGWLQVGEIIAVGDGSVEVPRWGRYHPHLHGDSEANNTLYVARDRLGLGGVSGRVAGGGVFERFEERLQLTAPGRTRAVWRLPRWFFPEDGRRPLTYHGNEERWTITEDHVILRSVPRGQEFVLDSEDYPEAVAWARELIVGAV